MLASSFIRAKRASWSSSIGGTSRPGTAGEGVVGDHRLGAAGGEHEDHLGGVVRDSVEAVPDAAGDVDEVAGLGDEQVVAVEELELAGQQVERLLLVRMRMRRRTAPGRNSRLEHDGLVTRTVYATVPPQVEYALTEPGRALNAALQHVAHWAETHGVTVVAARASHLAVTSRAPTSS